MSIRVELSGQLATFAGQSVVECPAADSLSHLLDGLVTEHPDLKNALFDENGTWRRTTLVAVDGEQVLDHDGTSVSEGSTVLILMPMAGG